VSAKLYTIAPSAPFADTLARGLIARVGDGPLALADCTIYLPTRRAQRTFGDAFARVLGGAALLPQFKALGDADEDELLFEPEAIDLPPAIAPMRRTLLLATLVQRSQDGEMGFAQAAALADSLAAVMDEMETHRAQLSALDAVVPGALAAHWESVRKFLGLLETHWPGILADEGRIGPADRRNRALTALAERLRADPPTGPVIAAGSTGSIPATATLLKAIAELPNGAVVLPGLDRNLDPASWDSLDPGHPQFGMKQLLGRIGARREDVADWDGTANAARERALREALRPAPTTDAWRALAEAEQAPAIAQGVNGISLIEAADAAEEASVIALVLREALEQPAKTATLVTPDRALARRVASELKRWEIDVDDSAGRPLSHTPPGTFLCLLAEAADEGFAPVPLLALLKHPLCTLGDEPGTFRGRVRELDMLLRGPRPDPGLGGIARVIPPEHNGLRAWFRTLNGTLHPIEARDGDLKARVETHLAVAEALAGNDLWKAEAGEVAGRFIKELLEAATDIWIDAGAYASLFRRLASLQAVRTVRTGHPRVAILGPLEARLQSFDTVVLGGLNEGSWPRTPGADPWFSRPMRKALGLEQPERAIGQAAHDFAMLSAGRRVVLTRATKSEGVPAVASRWVQRLTQLTDGLGLEDVLAPKEDYVALAQSLRDAGPVARIKMPRPAPPVAARPTRLPVTDIEKWVRDPYAIYARRILKLEVRKPLDDITGPLERGNAVHKALEIFVKEFPGELPPDAAVRLCEIADDVFEAEGTPKATLALWRPRFARAAQWFVEMDGALRSSAERSVTEIRGEMSVTPDFKLTGVADRIDLLPGNKGAILDYKTGQLPTVKQIESFLAPQLLLEAAMLAAGAFPGVGPREAEALLYLQFSGGRVAGQLREVDTGLVGEALDKLRKRIADFARPDTPYDPRLHPKEARVSGDYDHLARVREWSLSGWEAPDE
jgi:ATP-dependent helicase/nuclease subunit B